MKVCLLAGCVGTGLPDGFFSDKKYQFGCTLWSTLEWKMLLYFLVIWIILRPLGIFYGHLVYFHPLWYIVPSKIWQLWLHIISLSGCVVKN
jgi:hypothetical protein